MVAVKAGDVDGLLRRPVSAPVYLVFGPDSGLVSERARHLAHQAVDDPADAFQLIKLEGDAVAADPLKLADEANTIGLFGHRRAIWIKPTSRNLAPALTPVLNAPPPDTTIIIEAGDLAKSAPLRTLCERAQNALALPCYADGAREIAAVIDDMAREAGLRIAREAREHLAEHLGGDRIATRNEIAKLLLYTHGRGEISIDDIDAVIGDVSAIAADQVIDAAFSGDLPALDAGFRKLSAEGFDAGVLMGFALRHALMLAQTRLTMQQKKVSARDAAAGMRIHFKRKNDIEKQLARWDSERLNQAVEDCGRAIAGIRRQAALDDAIAQKALWGLALAARRATR